MIWYWFYKIMNIWWFCASLLIIAIYYKSTKLRQLFIKTNLHKTEAIARLYTNILSQWTGVIPPKCILDNIYNHFPKADNDSTHSSKRRNQKAPTNSPPTQDQDSRNIRTHQSTLQNSRRDRTTDHGGTSHQTAQPTSEQSAVRRYLPFTYILIAILQPISLFFLHRQVMPCKLHPWNMLWICCSS